MVLTLAELTELVRGGGGAAGRSAALETGAIDTLIVWESLEITRWELQHPQTNDTQILFRTPAQSKDKSFLKEDNIELVVLDEKPFSEWVVDRYKDFGCTLEFVTDRSQEGNQYVKGFGGVGGLLRYKVDFEMMDEDNYVDDADSDDVDADDANEGRGGYGIEDIEEVNFQRRMLRLKF